MLDKIKYLLKQDLVNTILHTYATRLLLIILGLVGNVIITRSLGVENYGVYTLTLTIIALGTQFGNFGLHSANIFYVAKKKMFLGMLLKNSILFSIIVGSFISIIVYLVYRLLPQLFNIDFAILFIVILIIPISLMLLLTKNLLIGIGKIKLDNKISIYIKSLTIILLLLSMGLFKLNLSIALCIFAIGLALSLFFVLKILKKNITYNYILSIRLLKKISKFGFKAYLSALFAFLVLKSDLFFVSYYLSKSELGYYSLAVSFIDYIYILPVIIGTILFQKLSSMKCNNDKYIIMRRINYYFTIGYAIFLLFIYLFSKGLIIFLYGDEFIHSIAPMNILLIAIFFMGNATLFLQYIASNNFPLKIVYIWGVGFLVNLVLNYVLIKSYALYGVSISTVISYLLIYLLSIKELKIQRARNEKS